MEDFEGSEEEEPADGFGRVRGAGCVGGFGPAGSEFGRPVGAGSDEEEPELEDVGEEDQDVSAGAGGEGDEADESPAEESERDAAFPTGPLERDDEEEPDVDLVDPLVPVLIVGESAEVDGLAEEEVGEVDEDGDQSADEGQRRTGSEPAMRIRAMTRPSMGQAKACWTGDAVRGSSRYPRPARV